MTSNLTPVIVNRVLVVEDDRDQADCLKALLEQNGYEVQVARDGGQAQSAVTMHPPDLVLLDLILPNDVSGFEVCERMKQADEALPIIILTAIDMDDARDLAARVGADEYLTKPFEAEQLLECIHDTAEKVWRRKHLGEDSNRAERVRFECPECGRKLKVSGSHRGQRLNCPQCGATVTVPRRD
jgi:DNA-binding response OmpR family regulator